MNTEKKTEETNDFLELKSEVSAGFAKVEQQMVTIFKTLEKIDHTINGNGQPGLVEKVARLQERLDGTWKTLLIIGWTANFLVAVGALVAAFFKH